ncbi:EpsG family protein [Sphingobacterium sp. Mn56C]|uniref:EpsG family protein n=1 Tax=Sphingobacterium sp. Mn56C TaxID=3395261 RepID=UPI003BD113EC
MAIYIGLLVIHLLCVKFCNKILLLISFILLFLVMGFRDINLGTDALNYQLMFNISSEGYSLDIEPLWYLLNRSVFLMGGDYESLLIISSILTLTPVYIAACLADKRRVFIIIFLYISLYYYCYAFNIIRQSIGMSFGILGLVLLNDKDKSNHKYFWLCLVIGGGFHSIIYSLIILKFIPRLFEKVNNIVVLQIVTFFIGLFFHNYLLTFLSRFFYSKYIDFEGGNLLGNLIYLVILNCVFIAISQVITLKNNWYYYMSFFVLVSNLFIRFPFGARFILLFGIIQIVFLPFLLKNNKLNTKYKSVILIAILTYGLINFFRILGAGEIVPYKGYFFNFII